MAEGNPIKYSDLVIDDGAIDNLIKAIDKLEKHFLSSQKKFRNEIEKTRKSANEFTDATDDQEAELEKLEKQLEKLIKANKELQESEDKMAEQKKSAVKLAKEEQRLRKKLIDLEQEQAKENAKLKIEVAERNKQLKEQIKREKGLTNAYDEQSARLGKLRKQYKGLAVEGKENTKAAQELLKEVTELDQKLKAVDKSVGQTQREVGNYKDQVKEALSETDLFGESLGGIAEQTGILGGVMAQLNVIIGLLTKSVDKETEEVVENTVASKVNEKQQKKSTIAYLGLSRAVKTTGRSMKFLNNTLKATALGALIVTLASVVAFLKKTREGTEALRRSSAKLSGATEVVTGRMAKAGKGALDAVGGTSAGILKQVVGTLTLNQKLFSQGFKDIGKATKDFAKTTKEATDGIVDAAKKGAEAMAAIEEKIIANEKLFPRLREEVAKLNAESEKAEEIEGDATRSFQERTKAIQVAAIKQQQAADKNLEIVRLELEVQEDLFKLKKEAGTDQLEDEQELFNKRIELIEAEKDAEIKALQITRVANQLRQDEIEKNLDILIDGFDNQKTVNELSIADDKERFDKRRKLLTDTIDLQKKILKEEVSEIGRATKKEINIRELIEEQDSKILNEKIRSYGLSEILEGRLLEIVREARTQERELDLELIELDRERLELRKEINQQLEDLRAQNIQGERDQAIELQRLDEERAIKEIEEQQKVFAVTSEEFKKLEAIKKEIVKKGVEDRKNIELTALETTNENARKQRELELLNGKESQEEINEELTELKIKQLEKEIELEKKYGRDAIDKELELARLKNQKEIDEEKKKAEKIRAIQDVTAKATIDAFDKVLKQQIENLEKAESKQNEIVDRQAKRAEQGLENNLAFEEKALAEIEQKKIKAQKKQVQLDKIRALYSAYSAASASGDENALVTVLRDFSILQGLESAILSFGTGTGEHGDVSDFMDANKNGSKNGNSIHNGVIRGESHAKRGKGIPVFVEGNEGIWKGSTMKKFGKDNFVALTSAIDSGMIGSNFMQPQVNAMQVVQKSGVDSRLLNEMKATRQAIENKPEQVVDVEKVSRNVIDFIDERKSGNKRVVNRHRVTKKRF